MPKAATDKKRRRSPLEIMQAIYNRVIVVAMNCKPAAVVVGVFAVAAGAFVLHHVPERFFPFAERDQFVVDVWLPEGWKVEATQAAVKRIEDVLHEEKEVVNYTSFIGSSFPRFYYNVNPQLPDKNYAQLLVSTESAEVTPKLVKELRPRLAQAAPEARVFLSELQQGPVQLAAIEVRLTGDDERVVAALGRSGQPNSLQRTPGSLDVHSDWREDAYRMKVNLRQEVANRLGFTNATIGQVLAAGFEGEPVDHVLGRRARYRRHLAAGTGLAPDLQRCRQYIRDVARNRRARAVGQHCRGVSCVGSGPHCSPQRSAHADDPFLGSGRHTAEPGPGARPACNG